MTPYEHKEANRYYWIVKGYLIPDAWSEKDTLGVYNSYFDRIWGNTEAYVHEEGFEEAYTKKFLTTNKI